MVEGSRDYNPVAMGKTIKMLLKAGDDRRLLGALEDAVLERWGPTTEESMTPEIRVFLLVNSLSGTFSNGGLKAYLDENLEDIEESIGALETIGVAESAADLRRVGTVFPGGRMPPGSPTPPQREFLEREALSLFPSDLVPELAAWVRARSKAFVDLPETKLSSMFMPAPIRATPGLDAGREDMADWLESRGVRVECDEGPVAYLSTDFSYEHCTHPESLATLARWQGRGLVEEIRLQHCRLGSAELELLPSFPSLRILDLTSARFPRGSLRPLAELSLLEELTLTRVPVSDDDLRPLGLLPSLRTLEIGSTRVRGSALELFGGLTSLEVGDAPLEDGSLPFLDQTRELSSLRVYGVRLTERALDRMARLPQLQELDLRNSGLGEASLKALGGHPELRFLTLEKMALTPAAAVHLAGLPGLRGLKIGDREKPREMLRRLRELRPDLKLPDLK